MRDDELIERIFGPVRPGGPFDRGISAAQQDTACYPCIVHVCIVRGGKGTKRGKATNYSPILMIGP